MTEINERVTVEFDEQSYYLDGEYWESWDNYGEEMADAINKLLNDLAEEKQQLINDCGILVQSNQDYRKENERLRRCINEIYTIARLEEVNVND